MEIMATLAQTGTGTTPSKRRSCFFGLRRTLIWRIGEAFMSVIQASVSFENGDLVIHLDPRVRIKCVQIPIGKAVSGVKFLSTHDTFIGVSRG